MKILSILIVFSFIFQPLPVIAKKTSKPSTSKNISYSQNPMMKLKLNQMILNSKQLKQLSPRDRIVYLQFLAHLVATLEMNQTQFKFSGSKTNKKNKRASTFDWIKGLPQISFALMGNAVADSQDSLQLTSLIQEIDTLQKTAAEMSRQQQTNEQDYKKSIDKITKQYKRAEIERQIKVLNGRFEAIKIRIQTLVDDPREYSKKKEELDKLDEERSKIARELVELLDAQGRYNRLISGNPYKITPEPTAPPPQQVKIQLNPRAAQEAPTAPASAPHTQAQQQPASAPAQATPPAGAAAPAAAVPAEAALADDPPSNAAVAEAAATYAPVDIQEGDTCFIALHIASWKKDESGKLICDTKSAVESDNFKIFDDSIPFKPKWKVNCNTFGIENLKVQVDYFFEGIEGKNVASRCAKAFSEELLRQAQNLDETKYNEWAQKVSTAVSEYAYRNTLNNEESNFAKFCEKMKNNCEDSDKSKCKAFQRLSCDIINGITNTFIRTISDKDKFLKIASSVDAIIENPAAPASGAR